MVTRGWNGYRNKSQHRKSTLEKKILPPFQQGFEPETFQSRVRCSNHRAIPAPLIFRHGPIIIYTRLPAGGTYYPICTFPASSESLIGSSDAFSAFCLRVSVIFPTCSLYPQQQRAYSALHPQAWTYIIQVHARRLFPSAVPWISEDRLFENTPHAAI